MAVKQMLQLLRKILSDSIANNEKYKHYPALSSNRKKATRQMHTRSILMNRVRNFKESNRWQQYLWRIDKKVRTHTNPAMYNENTKRFILGKQVIENTIKEIEDSFK